jgi:glycosyltransferase involved in cell wall biosynthesis
MTNTKKRILAISSTPFYTPKGSSLRVKSVIEKLVKEYDVDLLTFPVGEDLQIKGLNILRVLPWFKPKLDVSKITLKRIFLDKFLLHNAFFKTIFGKYEIIHCEDFEAASIGWFLSLFFWNKKYVYDLHNSIVDNLDITGKSKLFLKIARFLESVVISRFDLIILNWNMYKDIPSISKKKQFLFYDQTEVKEEKVDLPVKGKYLAYSGNFEKYQGIEEFLEVYKKANIEIPLILVGDSSKLTNIPQNVYQTGKLPITQSNYILKRALMALIPRTYGKQPGLKMIHHIMLGVPTLATDIEANRESLENGVNAILYKNDQELTDILRNIDKIDYDVLISGINKSQKKINEIWSDEYFLNNYREIYEN